MKIYPRDFIKNNLFYCELDDESFTILPVYREPSLDFSPELTLIDFLWDDEVVQFDLNQIKPIPLKDVLEKIGFVKDMRRLYSGLGIDLVETDTDVGFKYEVYNSKVKPFYYLHELQNYLWATNRIEITQNI